MMKAMKNDDDKGHPQDFGESMDALRLKMGGFCWKTLGTQGNSGHGRS
jgi:hypothetical protein